MNRYCVALCSSAFFLSASALAEVQLLMPANAELVLVNGVETSGEDKLLLNNGVNQIAFRYLGRYQQHGSQTQFQSDVIIVKFEQNNTEIALTLPKIRSSSAADKFDKSPTITLVDANDQSIVFEQGKLIKDGLQLGRDYEEEIAAYNLTTQSASLQLKPSQNMYVQSAAVIPVTAVAATQVSSSQNTAIQPNEQINVGQMLDFWYQQADEETRKAFKKRIENN
ncbi:YccT family protein [Shewanella sp. 125m-7]